MHGIGRSSSRPVGLTEWQGLHHMYICLGWPCGLMDIYCEVSIMCNSHTCAHDRATCNPFLQVGQPDSQTGRPPDSPTSDSPVKVGQQKSASRLMWKSDKSRTAKVGQSAMKVGHESRTVKVESRPAKVDQQKSTSKSRTVGHAKVGQPKIDQVDQQKSASRPAYNQWNNCRTLLHSFADSDRTGDVRYC